MDPLTSSTQPLETSTSVTDQGISAGQLANIKAQLDLVLLALEALVGVSSDHVLAAAKQLKLDHLLSDRVSLWRLRQASPLRKGQGRKKLDIDEARALVMVLGALSAHHQSKIREAVGTLEKLTAQNRPLHRAAILGDYLDNFANMYQERMEIHPGLIPEAVDGLALQLLIDLLFYSGPNGERQLWVALLDRTVED